MKISNYARPGSSPVNGPATPGGSGGTLGMVTDGVTSASGVNTIDFASGATVTDLGGGVAQVDVTAPAMALDDLTDVSAPTPAEGDALTWDGASDWVPVHALTQADVVALITPDIYYCDSLTVNEGTLAAGTHTDLHAVGGTTVQINETATTPGFDVEAAFSGVDGLTDVYVQGYYTGTHTVTVDLYNYDTTSWDTVITIPTGGTGMTLLHGQVASGSPYFDGGGNSVARFHHASAGNPVHRLYLDYLAISHVAGTAGVLALDDLTDVNAPSPSDGDALVWDDGASEWIAAAPSGVSDIVDIPTAETDTSLRLAPDGAGGVEWAAGGGGSGNVFTGGSDVTIPGLLGAADRVPASPNALDEEFDTTLSGWTTLGTVDTLNANTDIPSHVRLKRAVGAAYAMDGIYKACPASEPWTVTIKLADHYWTGNLGDCGLLIAEASPGKLLTLGQLAGLSGTIWATWTNRTSRITYGDVGLTARTMTLYFRIVVTSSSNIQLLDSSNGLIWHSIGSMNPGFTIGSVGLYMVSHGSAMTIEMAVDWMRFL